MNEKKTIRSSNTITLDVVDGDLELDRQATVKGSGVPPKVKVCGTVHCSGDTIFDGDLSAENLEAESTVVIHGDLEILNTVEVEDGRLEVHGNVSAKHVDVDDAIYVGKDLTVHEIEVGGSLTVNGNVNAEEVEVGGAFRAKEIAAKNVEVGGSLLAESQVDMQNLEVGGTVGIGGGKIHNVDVGGIFESSSPLRFGNIDVGGAVRLRGKNSGKKIDVGGSLTVEGELIFEEIEVGGKVSINGLAEGVYMAVGGKVDVDGSLKLSGSIDVGGRVDVSGEISAENITIGGVLRARKVTSEKRVKVGGSLSTDDGVRAGFVEMGRRSEARGPIVADEVIIGKDARVESIYGKEILMRKGANAENIYGEKVTVESHCRINGELKYTMELNASEKAILAKKPQKVTSLPPRS